jgi:octaprenyl-diphosphate synthase
VIELKQRILEAIAQDVEAIEIAITENLKPYLPLVSQVTEYIMFSGGKRIRPILMILSARLCGYQGNYDKTLSVVFEYLHAATLLHDDLVDDAEVRRGNPVAHSIWGNPATVLVGDFLLARSISIATETGKLPIAEAISYTTAQMSEGEIYQLLHKGDLSLDEKQYMEVVRRKTACLIQTACKVGALLAGASERQVQALSQYGHNLGCAFQLVDDLLDYTADEKVLGKAIGADLREGKLTLPLIHALANASEKNRQKMETIIRSDKIDRTDFEIICDLVNKHGGITYAKNRAKTLIDQAKERLTLFDPSESRSVLEDMADYVLTREM